MNKFRYLILILAAALPLALSCSDEGPNSPGGSGSDNTGVVVGIEISMDTKDIDAYQNPDCNGDGTADDPEEFTSDYGTANVDASWISGATAAQEEYKMYITKYTMEYYSDIRKSPPLRKVTIFKTVKIAFSPGQDTSASSFEVDIVDLATKDDFADSVTSGKYNPGVDPVRYTITYTFYGHDQYGESFTVISTTPIKIGDFNNC